MAIRGLIAAIALVLAGWISAPGVALAEPNETGCTELSSNGGCTYRNCTDAHNHGRYNMPRDDPAYCPSQDRDNDGFACEG